ncbi:hypothetical protein OAP56_02550, partial [Rickettsiaceae bacterium]|nr:hypothetical protein [Rickettsiaceae bacterium]
NKLDFIEYSANRYGIEYCDAKNFTSMFNDCIEQLIKETKHTHNPMHIHSAEGDAVILSKEDYNSLKKGVNA